LLESVTCMRFEDDPKVFNAAVLVLLRDHLPHV
jgi:hypothetical protein